MWLLHLIIIIVLWNVSPVFCVFYIIGIAVYYLDKSSKKKKLDVGRATP